MNQSVRMIHRMFFPVLMSVLGGANGWLYAFFTGHPSDFQGISSMIFYGACISFFLTLFLQPPKNGDAPF